MVSAPTAPGQQIFIADVVSAYSEKQKKKKKVFFEDRGLEQF